MVAICVISTEARNERSGEILLFCHKYRSNGKISPLQNLLKQIFPVEMTLYITIRKDYKQALTNRDCYEFNRCAEKYFYN